MKDPDKPSDFIHIANIIDGVLQQYGSRPGYSLNAIWRLWDEAVGETIAQNARPAALKDSLLIVHVSSSSWIHQLQFLRNDLIDQLNTALQKPLITEMKFKIGPINR